MNTQPAQGPWGIDEAGQIDPEYQISLGQEWTAVGTYEDGEGMSGVVALCHPKNSRLIAAAPELLFAVRTLLNCPDLSVEEVEPETRTALLIARAAIAKAEGHA